MSRDPKPTSEVSVAARDESRLRELDRRGAATVSNVGALLVRARHAWTATATVAPAPAPARLTTWVPAGAVGSLVEQVGGGVFRLLRSGVWACGVQAVSDAGAAGNFTMLLQVGDATSSSGGYTGEGFGGAGYDDRHIQTVAPYTGAGLAGDIAVLTRWLTAGTATRSVTCRLQLDLLTADPDSTPTPPSP